MSKLKSLPKPVKEGLDPMYPLNWYRHPGGEHRTVVGGYALYATTGFKNSGEPILRRLYMTCDAARARALMGLLKGLVTESEWKRLHFKLEDLIADKAFARGE
jgi:hypothetical protein